MMRCRGDNKLSYYFNILNVDFSETITVFEGYLDSLFYPNSIGVVGVNTDMRFIESNNLDIQYFFDNDQAGFTKSEQKIKEDAMTYSKEWFGKEIKSAEVMEEKFNIMLRYPKKEKGSAELDYNKPPTLSIKIPNWKTTGWQSEIYDEEGVPLYLKGPAYTHTTPLEFLKPKIHVICLIQSGGLWFVNGKVSITWNLKQAIVQKPKTTLEGQCFLRPKAEDREHILIGLKKALDHIDEIIQLIKKSKDVAMAHAGLMSKFRFSDRQSTAILEMRLQKLASLERQKI
ncbi:hypothetical protein EBS02_12860, partial [bacterium]|nr:hypothetical protein [bacterium]